MSFGLDTTGRYPHYPKSMAIRMQQMMARHWIPGLIPGHPLVQQFSKSMGYLGDLRYGNTDDLDFSAVSMCKPCYSWGTYRKMGLPMIDTPQFQSLTICKWHLLGIHTAFQERIPWDGFVMALGKLQRPHMCTYFILNNIFIVINPTINGLV